MKENFPFTSPKNTPALLIAKNLTKYQQQRGRLLKQLQQLGLDLSEYEHLPLKDLTAKTECIMNNTYSIKYLGLNKNQMGIISRRINPLTDTELKMQEQPQENYSVHKYFYPKPLRTGKKCHIVKTINVDNLQSEIKREFQQKRQQQPKKTIFVRKDDKMKTKMLGSWYSSSKDSNSHKIFTKPELLSPQNLGTNIQIKIDPTQSFSRFLNKGILIVRD